MPKKPSKRIYADVSAQDMAFLKAEANGKAIRAWIKARQTVRNIEEGKGADGSNADQ